MQRVGDFLGGNAVLDGEGEFLNHFTGARANNARAKQRAVWFGDDFYKAIVNVTSIGAADNRNWHQRFFNLHVALYALVFTHTNRGDFGVEEHDARHSPVI